MGHGEEKEEEGKEAEADVQEDREASPSGGEGRGRARQDPQAGLHAHTRSTLSGPGLSCVLALSSTCAYLADGTKIVIRRDQEGRVWLENVPQAVIRLA